MCVRVPGAHVPLYGAYGRWARIWPLWEPSSTTYGSRRESASACAYLSVVSGGV
uniref:Uncharacterized protein n=1 Tax=Rhodococcus hoagii TaxID=43767 RepID=A0A0F6YS13_RHOHA|nr:hypothetical protein pVAPN2012_0330 [Prescottella equi]AKG90492.1 hypothetical protein pVAPN_0330 [Prescottella equi]